MGRFICGVCQAQYRHEADFAEHARVGCRPAQGSGRQTWSEKDREEEPVTDEASAGDEPTAEEGGE